MVYRTLINNRQERLPDDSGEWAPVPVTLKPASEIRRPLPELTGAVADVQRPRPARRVALTMWATVSFQGVLAVPVFVAVEVLQGPSLLAWVASACGLVIVGFIAGSVAAIVHCHRREVVMGDATIAAVAGSLLWGVPALILALGMMSGVTLFLFLVVVVPLAVSTGVGARLAERRIVRRRKLRRAA